MTGRENHAKIGIVPVYAQNKKHEEWLNLAVWPEIRRSYKTSRNKPEGSGKKVGGRRRLRLGYAET